MIRRSRDALWDRHWLPRARFRSGPSCYASANLAPKEATCCLGPRRHLTRGLGFRSVMEMSAVDPGSCRSSAPGQGDRGELRGLLAVEPMGRVRARSHSSRLGAHNPPNSLLTDVVVPRWHHHSLLHRLRLQSGDQRRIINHAHKQGSLTHGFMFGGRPRAVRGRASTQRTPEIIGGLRGMSCKAGYYRSPYGPVLDV